MRKKEFLRYSIAALLFFLLLLSVLIWQNNQSIRIRQMMDENEVFEKIEILEEWQENMNLAGMAIQRTIRVMNASDVSVFVRASFEEILRYVPVDSEEILLDQAANEANAPELLPVISRFNENEILARGYQNVTNQVSGIKHSVTDGQVMVWISEADIEELASKEDDLEKQSELHPDGLSDTLDSDQNSEESSQPDMIDDQSNDSQEPISVNAHFSYSYRQDLQPVMQKMNGELLLLNPQDLPDQWLFEASSLSYSYYAEDYRYLVRNWAQSQLASPFSSNEETTGFVYLGQQGTVDNLPFDYTTTDSGLGTAFQLPEAISAFPDASGFYPNQTVKRLSSFVTGEPAQLIPESIMIEFGAVSDYRQIRRDTWIYNPDDGWFYYSLPINMSYHYEGNYGVTQSLIEQLNIDSSVADDPHLTYELLPKVEVIQTSDQASLTEIFQLDNEQPDSASGILYRHFRSLQ